MLKRLVTVFSIVLPSIAFCFDLSCTFGATCISTQGTKIPSKKVIELSGYCDDFTRNDIGRRVLKMSFNEINIVAGKNINHPVFSASYAFDKLQESELNFIRQANVEDTDYNQIKLSCVQLLRDFNNRSKWSQ
ncbi:MAG: hypothetical protein BWK72_20930 [Rhodoferax ferrireducens]|uniref:Uncharacterized protein n=1 Tax=Rhodoferax ferrireducens TaxID=192843 RepID=A0A1W9KNL7_9BURK|nr:MAG: hypothetical protein BWK72_20930 [Rhodoferax ferrireducens]